jgi:putative hemolysin
MKTHVVLLAAMTTLAACSSIPYATSGDGNQVTVNQPYVGKFDREKAMHTAEEYCKKYGKKARLKADEGKQIVYDCY